MTKPTRYVFSLFDCVWVAWLELTHHRADPGLHGVHGPVLAEARRAGLVLLHTAAVPGRLGHGDALRPGLQPAVHALHGLARAGALPDLHLPRHHALGQEADLLCNWPADWARVLI